MNQLHQTPLLRAWQAAALLSVLLPVAGLSGQAPAEFVLARPEAVLPHEFTYIEDIHELPGGQLAVLDRGEQSAILVDATFQAVQPVGRIGSGPGEYRDPRRLFGLDGQDFAIFEGSRFVLLRYGANAEYEGSLSIESLGRCRDESQSPVGNSVIRTTDASGRVYMQGPAVARGSDGSYVLADSAPVLRWSPPCALDTAAYVPVAVPSGSRVMTRAGGQPFVGGAPPDRSPFASAAQWAALPDGRVAVVHLSPYRVEVLGPGGARSAGRPLADTVLPLTAGHRALWREIAERARPVSTVFRDGGMSLSMRAGVYREPDEWPRGLPPFPTNAVRVAPDGHVWVERNVKAGAPLRVDVFDVRGERLGQVVLPAGRRVLGIGRRALYLVTQDADDIQYIERYRIPAGLMAVTRP